MQKTAKIATLQDPVVGQAMDEKTKQFHDLPLVKNSEVILNQKKIVHTEQHKQVNIDLMSGKHISMINPVLKPEYHGLDRTDPDINLKNK